MDIRFLLNPKKQVGGRVKRDMSLSPEKSIEKRQATSENATRILESCVISISLDESDTAEPSVKGCSQPSKVSIHSCSDKESFEEEIGTTPESERENKPEGIYQWIQCKNRVSENMCTAIFNEYLAGRIAQSRIAASPIVAPNQLWSCIIILDPQASGLRDYQNWPDVTDDQMGAWIRNGTSKEKQIVDGTELTIHQRYWKNELGCLRHLYFFTEDDAKLVGPWIICYQIPVILAGCDLSAEGRKKPHGNA